MPKHLLSCALAPFLLATLCASICAAEDKEAIRRQQEQQRQQQLQQERANLESQIRAGQRQLQQARQQEEQIRKSLPNLEKQYREALKIAEQFKPEVAKQQQEVEKARAQQKAAGDKAREARNEMIKIGDDLEKQQPTSSPIAQARAHFEKAQQQYDALSKRILESPEYKQAFQAAVDAGDRTKAGEIRNSFLKGNTELIGLQVELKSSRVEYEELRKKIVEGHADYQRAAEGFKSAQTEMSEAGKQLEEAVKKHTQAKATLANKLSIARKAATLGKQGQARVQQLSQAQQQIDRQIQQLQNRRNNLR